jgi:hypothetical protein
MEYPAEVVTEGKKSKREVRNLVDRGIFVRYEYLDPETGERAENKTKIVLRKNSGEMEEYFIIPMSGNRSLLLRAEEKGERMIWDVTKAVRLFE